MKYSILENTDLRVSRFIFGTASLFNVGGPGKRRALLEAAVEAGFSHFDTAPYYGFGLAERDLAPVLKAHPEVTFTTKVGIYSPGGENQSDAAVFLRKAIGRFIRPVSRPEIDFSLARARQALEGSLRRTGRQTIDLYMLHEPDLPLVATDDWRRWLEDRVQAGTVRQFGLALTADRLAPFLDAGADLGAVIQICDSLKAREADLLPRHGRPLQITYGYVSAAMAGPEPVSVPDILAQALRRNPAGAVIVSSTKISRLAQYGRIADEVSP